MATRWRSLHKKARRRPIVRCERCGSRDVMPCQFYPWEKPDRWLCSECAERDGFCAGCGIFCAGIESFEFGRYPGYCDNCQDELRADDDAWEEEELEEDFDFAWY